MNKMRTLAKIVFIGLGVYIITGLLPALFMPLYMLSGQLSFETFIQAIALWLVYLLYLAAVIYFLIYKSEKWAGKIVTASDPQDDDNNNNQIQWLPAIFRLVAVAAGIFFIYRFATGISQMLSYFSVMRKANVDNPQKFSLFLKTFLGWVTTLPIGIYLLYGAPHFVRWQVKKTLQQCKHLNENEDTQKISN